MVKYDFYNWMQKEASKQIDYAMNSNINFSTNIPKQNAFTLYSIYLQTKLTKGLILATWALAIGTIILSILTLYLTFFTNAT